MWWNRFWIVYCPFWAAFGLRCVVDGNGIVGLHAACVAVQLGVAGFYLIRLWLARREQGKGLRDVEIE